MKRPLVSNARPARTVMLSVMNIVVDYFARIDEELRNPNAHELSFRDGFFYRKVIINRTIWNYLYYTVSCFVRNLMYINLV